MLAKLFGTQAAPTEQRSLQVTPWGPWTGTVSNTGIYINPDSAMQLLTVYGCVSLISDTIATLPRDIYRNNGDGTKTEIETSPKWLDQPNPDADIVDFLTQSLWSLLLEGNCYWAYGVDGNYLPNMVTVLDPSTVDIRDDGYWVNGRPYRGRIFHIRGLTRPGDRKGLSPVEAAKQSVGIGLQAQQFASSFYTNGATLSGVIEVPGQMTEESANEMKRKFAAHHAGSGNAHSTGVITNGATFKPLSITPEQAQFLESRQFQAAEIAGQMFLLDPSMLGISAAGTRGQNLTYANLEQRGIHLVQFTLMRWLIRLERAFTFLLPQPQFFKFNVDAIQRADLKTRYEAYRIANPTQAWMSGNEIRDLEDEPPLPGLDTLPTAAPAAAPPFGGPQ